MSTTRVSIVAILTAFAAVSAWAESDLADTRRATPIEVEMFCKAVTTHFGVDSVEKCGRGGWIRTYDDQDGGIISGSVYVLGDTGKLNKVTCSVTYWGLPSDNDANSPICK